MARPHRVLARCALSLALGVGCGGGGRAADAGSAVDTPDAAGSSVRDAAGGDASPSDALDARTPDAAEPTGACTHFDPLRQPFFGDLHVHTALSLDANVQGTRVRPADAYRFARGEALDLPPYDANGQAQRSLRLARPLDFAAVTDHAEFLGLVRTCADPQAPGYDALNCQGFRAFPDISFFTLNSALSAQQGQARYPDPCTEANDFCGAAARALWEETQAAARAAHDTSAVCRFTSFVAYEWSASPGTKNLHRNVIFANDIVPTLPFSYFDGNLESELWDALDRDCIEAGKGCDALTIPHNSNLSAGLMFEPVQRSGAPFDAQYAARRRSFEPLAEIFQHKGASECLPGMGNDEQCGFELLPYNTLASVALGLAGDTLEPRDYLRFALGQGLEFEASLGQNPFAFGFIGSTDSHVGAAGGVHEVSFAGHGGAGQSGATPNALPDLVWLNPGGLAVLWAEENTRASLFAAMRRREAYASSGPRDTLRFFAGYDLPAGMCARGSFAQAGYEGGVPMGGDLTSRATAPRMAVSVLLDPSDDPGMARLARLQIVKGSLLDGKAQFRVFDVASAAEGELDLESCAPSGATESALCGEFTDPEFDPSTPAFYYARALHGPSCRWQTRLCRAADVRCSGTTASVSGLDACCAGYPETVVERVWSSPVFVHPAAP